MSVTTLIPGSTQRARQTALSSFELFLVNERAIRGYIERIIAEDASGVTLLLIVDKYAMHLAFKSGRCGKSLAKSTVASYFGNVKNHCLDLYASQRVLCKNKLSKMASTLKSHCSNRGDVFVNKVLPCSRQDLQVLSTLLYRDANSTADYGDVALLNMMWYLFGRSSDSSWLLKRQLSVYPGVSLFKDREHLSAYPVHALAVAVIVQVVPSPFLLDHIPATPTPSQVNPVEDSTLLDLLLNLKSTHDTTGTDAHGPNKGPKAKLGIHSCVNWLLQRLTKQAAADQAKMMSDLTSHSFRQGAAQSANSDAKLSTQWILDRGG